MGRPEGEARSLRQADKPQGGPRGLLRSALGQGGHGELYVLDSLSFDEPSTKAAKEVLGKMDLEGPVLLVLTDDDANAALSFRNLPEVTVVGPFEYGIYELLGAREVVFSRAAYSRLAGSGEGE
jgi:large subunit ribosomal protein L4